MSLWKSHPRATIIAAIVGALAIAGGISTLFRHHPHPTPATPVPMVTVQTLATQVIPQTVGSFAQVVSPQAVTLKAQASGMVTAIHFQAGQTVTAGQALYSLQANDTSAQVKQLAAQLAIAQQIYQRDLRLQQLAPNALSPIQLLQARSHYEQSLAEYREAEAIHSIVAPISGRISDTDLAVGDFVNSGDTLATLAPSTRLQLKYELPNKVAALAAVGQAVSFQPTNSPDTYSATVSYVAPLLNANDYQLTVRANLAVAPLLINTFGEVTQVLNPNRTVLAVPQSLVHTDLSGFYVFVLDNQHVGKRYFTPGTVNAAGLISVANGLTPGTVLITSNPDDFTNGQMVQVSAA